MFADIAMLRDYLHESSVRSSAKTELLFIRAASIEPSRSRITRRRWRS
jgi:subfamily B ATP-binding cassette protein HlyB/CyaB